MEKLTLPAAPLATVKDGLYPLELIKRLLLALFDSDGQFGSLVLIDLSREQIWD